MTKIQKLIELKKAELAEVIEKRGPQELEMFNLSKKMLRALEEDSSINIKEMCEFGVEIDAGKYKVGPLYTQLKSIFEDEPVYILIAVHADDGAPVEAIDFDDLIDSLQKWMEE